MRNFLYGRRRGRPVTVPVVYCSDPLLVKWPGIYAVKANDKPDPHRPVHWVTDESLAGGGSWAEGRA